MTDKHSSPRLSVVIPVFNERATIEELLRRVRVVSIDKEIVVVDDGSTDGTREILQRIVAHQGDSDGGSIRVFYQSRNQGKGAAVRRGFEEAKGEVVIIQDADLEYHPEDYERLLLPIERGEADVVYGSRFLGGPHRVLFFWHYVGNRLLTLLSNMFTNLNLSDVWTCYKVFRREVLADIRLQENGFGFEQEITSKVAAKGLRVYEVPIAYYGRTYEEGKKITWRDGVRGLWCIVRYSLF
ncbi:MAG: glycosyltransferase family 2 protein [Acidobacteriota bacterium]